MKTINLKFKKGFSFMEMIIYLTIFTTISILVINSFIIILSSFSVINANHNLLESGSMAMDRISREIRQAQNIDLTHSSFDSNSSFIRLNNVDRTSYIDFAKNNDELEMSKNGSLFDNLLAQNISLNKLVLRHIEMTNGEAVKIEMELGTINSKVNKTANFYNTVILRGGY